MSEEYAGVDLVPDETVKRVATAVLLAALMAAMAFVEIPYPLSGTNITLQVMGALLAGLLIGPLWGGFAMLLYLTVGFAGVPVFADGGGLGYIWHYSAGYVVGFLVAAVVVGALVHRGFEPRRLETVSLSLQIVALLAGVLVVYALGVPWMMVQLGLSPGEALWSGALVFLPADLVKVAATVLLVRSGHLVQR